MAGGYCVPETCEFCKAPARMEISPTHIDARTAPHRKCCALHLGDLILDTIADGIGVKDWNVRVL